MAASSCCFTLRQHACSRVSPACMFIHFRAHYCVCLLRQGVCVCACVCVCVCVCMSAQVHVQMHICRASVRACMHTYLCLCVNSCWRDVWACAGACVRGFTSMLCQCVPVCMLWYACTGACACVCAASFKCAHAETNPTYVPWLHFNRNLCETHLLRLVLVGQWERAGLRGAGMGAVSIWAAWGRARRPG